jgi:hypothetical protein
MIGMNDTIEELLIILCLWTTLCAFLSNCDSHITSSPLLRPRKLKAEAFSEELQELVSKFSEKAAPQIRDILDSVAVPFIRRFVNFLYFVQVASAATPVSHVHDKCSIFNSMPKERQQQHLHLCKQQQKICRVPLAKRTK